MYIEVTTVHTFVSINGLHRNIILRVDPKVYGNQMFSFSSLHPTVPMIKCYIVPFFLSWMYYGQMKRNNSKQELSGKFSE